MSTAVYTEDEVRDIAFRLLNFSMYKNTKFGVGQITTFNQLGFKGVSDKPDGWYLPDDKTLPAIVLEAKSSITILKQSHIDELLKNVRIVATKYKKCIGILYNFHEVKAFIDGVEISVQPDLQNKEYYIGLFNSICSDESNRFRASTIR